MRTQDASAILSEKILEGHKNLKTQNLTEILQNVTSSIPVDAKIDLSLSKNRNPDGLTEAGKAYTILVLFAVVFIIMSIAIYVKHRQTQSDDDLLLVRNADV